MNKIMLYLLGLLLILIPFENICYADGFAFKYNFDEQKMYLVGETRQIAYVNYIDGYEHLIINVNLKYDIDDNSNTNLFWIFPIPAQPQDISLDIIKDFSLPSQGKKIDNLYREKLRNALKWTVRSQIYPLSFLLLFWPRGGEENEGETVTTHQVVEKMGLRSEIITARDSNSYQSI